MNVGDKFKITQDYIDWYKLGGLGSQYFEVGDIVEIKSVHSDGGYSVHGVDKRRGWHSVDGSELALLEAVTT